MVMIQFLVLQGNVLDNISQNATISVFEKNDFSRNKKLRWSEMQSKEGTTSPVNFDPRNRPRRQDYKGDVVENGMFYFSRRELIEDGLFQGGKCGYVEIPQEYSVEIDSPFDLAFAEQVLSQQYIQLFM